ncbi:MAG: hypothetical protein QXY82_01360 [Desulfurococcaceae archaeon]
MKRVAPVSLALMILLFLLLQTVRVCANAIGPGIDLSSGTLISVAEDGTGYWHTDHIRIEFSVDFQALCTFYSGYGAMPSPSSPPYGVVKFYLQRDNEIVAERTFTIYGMEYFATRQLFTVNVTPGTYTLGIQLLPRDADSFIGRLELLGYGADTDPSVTYYYHIFAEGWVQGEYDIAWQAICGYYSSQPQPPPSQAKAEFIVRDVRIADNKVNVSFTLENFKPNSEVEIYYADLYGMTAGGMQLVEYYFITKVQVNEDGNYSGYVLLDKVSEEDWLEARGYDLYSNYVIVQSTRFNVTLKPGDWLSVAMQIFRALFSYMYLAFSVVVSLIPYAGLFYMLAFLGVVFKCMHQMSVLPLFDFFYRQYVILVNLAQLIIKIAEKIYEAGRTLVDWLIKLVDMII